MIGQARMRTHKCLKTEAIGVVDLRILQIFPRPPFAVLIKTQPLKGVHPGGQAAAPGWFVVRNDLFGFCDSGDAAGVDARLDFDDGVVGGAGAARA